ncbi:hypothetical protein GCM10011358_18960 [Sinisalibacter lacisalsi]|uniref:Uncharacterized protein n=1 Tax=Sinisalibacter lacisalsi TaxID=1526570 RepID=A0ABQ1QNM4_9RHOB|nr:hypothetical protein GCM10011358_18960 [Sinisalibacter lacisalsi]
MADHRILAVAAASGRVGYAFLVGDKLRDWHVSYTAAKSPTKAAEEAQKWINRLKPDVVVTEKAAEAARKGKKTKAIIGAIARTAEHNYLLNVSVARVHDYANKYEEAAALAAQYPAIEPWLPKKRRFFDNEPRNTVLFEALSFADTIRRGGSIGLAAMMG